MKLQFAEPSHAVEIAAVKSAAWPDETADVAYIARAIEQPERCTVIALDTQGDVVGFTDGFMTLSPAGVYRWEVDLVAVHPSARGAGIARQMIAESTAFGREMGASLTRALIHVENVASQRSFAQCGFAFDPTLCSLLVSSVGGVRRDRIPPSGTHIIPVSTLGYRGIWLEGQLTTGSFIAAQNIRKYYGWDVAGAVLPSASQAVYAAESVGYTRVGEYQWWTKALG